MKTALWAVGALALASSGLNASTLLDLTALSGGPLTNQVASQGVVFSGNASALGGGSDLFNVALGTTYLNFFSGSDPGVTDSLTLTEAGIDTDYDSFFDGATITAYDVYGNLLETQTFEPEGPYVGTLPPVSLTFANADGINELKFVGIRDYAGGGLFPLTLTFDTVSTPEPAAIWLMAGGLVAAALLRRRIA